MAQWVSKKVDKFEETVKKKFHKTFENYLEKDPTGILEKEAAEKAAKESAAKAAAGAGKSAKPGCKPGTCKKPVCSENTKSGRHAEHLLKSRSLRGLENRRTEYSSTPRKSSSFPPFRRSNS